MGEGSSVRMNFAAPLSHFLSSQWKDEKREGSNGQRFDHTVTRMGSEAAPQSSAPSFGKNQIFIDLCHSAPSLTAAAVVPAHRAESWLGGPSVAGLQRGNFLSAVGRQQISTVEVLLPLQFPFGALGTDENKAKEAAQITAPFTLENGGHARFLEVTLRGLNLFQTW